MRSRIRTAILSLIPILLAVIFLLISQFSPFISYAWGAIQKDYTQITSIDGSTGSVGALLAGDLGSGSLTARLAGNVSGIAPGEIAVKIADVGLRGKDEGERLSTEEAYAALLCVSTTGEELERKTGAKKNSLPKEVQEEIIAGTARMAASGNRISSGAVNGIIATALDRHGEKAAMPLLVEEGEEPSRLLQVTATNPQGESLVIPDENIRFQSGSVVMVIDPPRNFTPGLYHMNIQIANPITGEVEEFEQDFTWGVLAMNTDQDVYKVGQTADIHIGVLDDEGEIVEDADVTLRVVAPDGSSESLEVPATGTCGIKLVGFIEPDYRTSYTFSQAGEYRLNLSATHENGTRSMTSTVEVVENAPYIVKRTSATRNYPFGPTPMTVEVEFSEDFSGKIVDVVPADFDISEISPSADVGVTETGDAKVLVWDGSYQAGETASFSYEYDAPDVSPEFYTVGPLRIGDAVERRVWQIANDLAESYVYGGGASGSIYSTHLPSGTSNLLTTSPYTSNWTNALASNPDNGGICYYGNNKTMYYWNPAEGTGAGAHHVLYDFSSVFPYNVGYLESGGGAYLDGKLYIGPEYTSSGYFYNVGDMYDIYEVTLSADGQSFVSQRRLNVRGISGYRANQFGGFGDLFVHRNGGSGLIYASTSSGWFWSFDIGTNTFTRINTSTTWVAMQLGQTISGTVYAGNHGTSQLQELDIATGNLVGSPIGISYQPADLTSPYNARTGTTDVSLTKAVDDATPYVAETVTFTLTVANGGPDGAYNITVEDVIPDGFSYVAGSIAGGDSNDDSGAPTLTWTINTLASGASTDLTFEAIVNSGGDHTNTAGVTALDQYDPNPGNETDSETVYPQVASITINASPGSIAADGTTQSTITATARDINGDPVGAGYNIAFSTDLGTVLPVSGVTDANGQVISYLSGSTVGTATVGATADSGAYSETVVYLQPVVTASVSGGNGSVSPASQAVDYGTSASVDITPDTGYHIDSITDNSVGQTINNPYVINNVTTHHTVVVTFAINTYTITVSSSGNGSVGGGGTYTHGDTVNLSATPDVGYQFVNWTEGGTEVSTDPNYSFTAEADRDLVGNFAINTFTITATAGSNGTIDPIGAVSVNYGADQTFTITPDANYHVADVLVDGSSVGAVTSYTFTAVDADHTIDASFAIDTFTITATAGLNGTIDPAGAVTVDYGQDQTFTITPDANYHVADVLVDGSSVGAVTSYTFTAVDADHTIDASFAIDTFTITATAGSNGTIDPIGAVSVNYGSDQTFTITPDANYHVADVLVDGSSVGAVTSYTFTAVDADHTIDASFAIDTFTITATAGAGGTIDPIGAVSVNYGSDQTFTITPDANYHVADVLVDGSSVGAVTSYTFTAVDADHTIDASFAIDTFTITATAGAGGTIDPIGAVSVNYGADQTFTITPDANYHVADVLVDGSSVGAVTSYTFTAVDADHTIDASFAIDTFTITATAGANGTIDPSGAVSVNYGADQTFTITPDANYHVADVLVDGSSVGAVASYTFTAVDADHTIDASFAIDTFTITATAGAGGTIDPIGAVSVNYGSDQTVTITPDANYHVADVLVDGSSVGAVTSYTLSLIHI